MSRSLRAFRPGAASRQCVQSALPPRSGLLPLAGLLLALAASAGASALAAAAAPNVARWGRFEAAVPNSRAYPDPHRDVVLEVTYTRPDRSTVAFRGFHDGNRGWKIRFMPDQVGRWIYAARFSDGTPGVTGSFDCTASDAPGPISVHTANPIWFGRRGGDATLIRGLHVGDRFFARNWDDPATPADGEKRAAFLDWARRQGYNTLSIASHYLNRQAEGRGAGWDTPRLWPLDAAEFQRLELILDDLAARGWLVYPFAGFFGRDAGFPRDPADQTVYLRTTLARLAPYGNLLFNVAGPEPLLRGRPYLTADEVNRLGAEIARLDPFAHPLSVHNPTGDDPFKDSAWLTYGTLQGPKTFSRAVLSAGLLTNHHPAKPLLAQETLWSGNSVHIRRNQADYSDADLRKNAFAIHFCAASLIFADNDGDSSSGFSGTLDLAIRRQPRHDIVRKVWDAVAALPWQRTTPRPDLVEAPAGVTPLCLADPGQTYLVYLESRGPVRVRTTGGPFAAEWVNAQDAADRRRAGTIEAGAALTPPDHGEDWLLVLRKPAALGMPAATPAARGFHWLATRDFEVVAAPPLARPYSETKSADPGEHGLAVNPTLHQDRFAAVELPFAGAAGTYTFVLHAVAEEDGESEYRLAINGSELPARVNPVTSAKRQPVQHRWAGVKLRPGDRIKVHFAARSNGRIPEGAAFAWSRGRWRGLEAIPESGAAGH